MPMNRVVYATGVAICLSGPAVLAQQGAGPSDGNTPPTDRPRVFSLAQLQTWIKGDQTGRLLEGMELYSLNLLHRKVEPATVHGELADLYIVQEGTATLETGGTILDPKPASRPGDLTGSGIRGGHTQVINKGDVVFIPPGVPHRISGGDIWYLNVHFPAKKK